MPVAELSIEKLREEELEEARAIQSVMLPEHSLRSGAVRWIWVHGSFGWNGVLLLVATLAIFGFVDYRLLRFYERRGTALRVERHIP